MKIRRFSKKMSQMSPRELYDLARTSKQRAIDVISFLNHKFSREDNAQVNKIFVLIANDPDLSTDPGIRYALLNKVLKQGDNESSRAILRALLKHPVEEDAQDSLLLTSILNKYSDTSIAAIIMMSAGTPDSVLHRAAPVFGLGPTAFAPQVKKRKTLVDNMIIENARGTQWNNDMSGSLFGLSYFRNKDPETRLLIENSRSIPKTLISGIMLHGDDELKEIVMQKSFDMTPSIFLAVLEEAKEDEDGNANRIVQYLSDPTRPMEDKEEVIEGVLATQPESVVRHMIRRLSDLESPEIFDYMLNNLLPRGYHNVPILTENFAMSLAKYKEVESILQKHGLLDQADPDFIEFVRDMDEPDIDEDILDEQYNDYELYATWYKRLTKHGMN